MDGDPLSNKTLDVSESLLPIAIMKTDWPAAIPDNVAVPMACHVQLHVQSMCVHKTRGIRRSGGGVCQGAHSSY